MSLKDIMSQHNMDFDTNSSDTGLVIVDDHKHIDSISGKVDHEIASLKSRWSQRKLESVKRQQAVKAVRQILHTKYSGLIKMTQDGVVAAVDIHSKEVHEKHATAVNNIVASINQLLAEFTKIIAEEANKADIDITRLEQEHEERISQLEADGVKEARITQVRNNCEKRISQILDNLDGFFYHGVFAHERQGGISEKHYHPTHPACT